MPVMKAVRATEIMRAPVALRLPGLAVCQMASAAAGRANIMIGKNPVMKLPVHEFEPSTPWKKQVRSPCAVAPEAVRQDPSWNQGTELSRWCRPKGMSSRLTVPKTKTARAPARPLEFPALMSQPPSWSLMSQLKAG